MPIRFVQGDPLLTHAQMLAFGHNARGRTETDNLTMQLMRRYPAAFSAYSRQTRQERLVAGEFFLWTESFPKLLFLIVRDSSVGATRLRYVQKVLITIARDYPLYSMASLAIAPLGNSYERAEIQSLYPTWLDRIALPVIVYTDYVPDLQADESI